MENSGIDRGAAICYSTCTEIRLLGLDILEYDRELHMYDIGYCAEPAQLVLYASLRRTRRLITLVTRYDPHQVQYLTNTTQV